MDWRAGVKNGWVVQDGAWHVHSAGYLKDARGAVRYVLVVLSWGHSNLDTGVAVVETVVRLIQAALHGDAKAADTAEQGVGHECCVGRALAIETLAAP